jgi:hypothetical protein
VCQTNHSRRSAVAVAMWCVSLAAATAAAQQGGATSLDAVSALHVWDLNGRQPVSEQVVTLRSESNGQEQVVTEIYGPSLQEGRLALRRRVRRVTTATSDGSHTVEDTFESNSAAPSEPVRLVRRRVTTTRVTGPDSSVSESELFEVDINGRLAPVAKQTERLTHQ